MALDAFADIRCRALSVLVDVLREAFIGNIHLPETGEDLVGAGVHPVGDELPERFDLQTRRFIAGSNALGLQRSEARHDRVHPRGQRAPVGRGIILRALRALAVSLGGAPARADFSFIRIIHPPPLLSFHPS